MVGLRKLARLLALHLENGHSVITPAATVAGARWLGSLAGAAELNGLAAAVRGSASDRAASHATASPSTGHWVGGRARASNSSHGGFLEAGFLELNTDGPVEWRLYVTAGEPYV